ncbi:MAG: response regulator transcription factor [Campylobacterales bacterium]
MKIMLIEDEYSIAQAIKRYLEDSGSVVDAFFDGAEAMKELERGMSYDAYIVDINLPGASGLEILAKIKSTSEQLPVIIISADSDIETIDRAYKLGTEDYLKKPFHIKELAIKLAKLSKNTPSKVAFGDGLVFDVGTRKLFKDEEEIELTKKELLFLELLLQNRGKIVTNDHIQNIVYEYNYMSDLALRTLVKRVRLKVGKELISNVSGLGYKID